MLRRKEEGWGKPFFFRHHSFLLVSRVYEREGIMQQQQETKPRKNPSLSPSLFHHQRKMTPKRPMGQKERESSSLSLSLFHLCAHFASEVSLSPFSLSLSLLLFMRALTLSHSLRPLAPLASNSTASEKNTEVERSPLCPDLPPPPLARRKLYVVLLVLHSSRWGGEKYVSCWQERGDKCLHVLQGKNQCTKSICLPPLPSWSLPPARILARTTGGGRGVTRHEGRVTGSGPTYYILE